MSFLKYSSYVYIVAALLFGFLLANLVTLVYAHGGDINLIHACVKNTNGDIRIIGANNNCNGNETPLDWRKEPVPGTEFPFICNGCDLTEIGDRFSSRDLTNAFIIQSQLMGLNLSNTNFSYSNLKGSSFESANLSNSNLQNVNFTDANLVNADLSNTARTGIIWSNTICPDGTNSDNNGNTCEGHLTP